LLYEKRKVLLRLHAESLFSKCGYYQLLPNENTATALAAGVVDRQKKINRNDLYSFSSIGTSLVNNSFVMEQFKNGLFSFPFIFLKSQLLSQFQQEHSASSSVHTSPIPKYLFSVSSSITSNHSFIEEIELFHFSCEEIRHYLTLHALSVKTSSSSSVFNNQRLADQLIELYSTFLVIWQFHIYLITHSLFYEIFQQNLLIISQHEQSDGDRTHLEGPSSTSSSTGPKVSVPFLRPSQQLPQQQHQKLATFTPIYQSTQISLSNIHQIQPPNSNKESDIFKLQEPINSKIYLEQVILTSSSSLSIFLSWIIVFRSVEVRLCLLSISFLTCFAF
jgi:hypothetical protein